MDPLPNKQTVDPLAPKPPIAKPSDPPPTKPHAANTSVVHGRVSASAPPTEDSAQLSGSKRKTWDGAKEDDVEEEVQVVGEKKKGDVKSTKKEEVKEKKVISTLDIFEFTLDKEEGSKWTSNGMPSMIKLKPIQGTSDVWKFMRELEVPISKVVESNKRRPKSLQFQLGGPVTKLSTHMCTLCLEEVMLLGEPKHNESWEKALYKVPNSSNGLKHLVGSHAKHDSIHALLQKKTAEEDPKGALEAVPPEDISHLLPQSNTVSTMLIKQNKKHIPRGSRARPASVQLTDCFGTSTDTLLSLERLIIGEHIYIHI